MSNQPICRLAVALLIALTASAAVAESVYKWTDAQGVTHFSAQPPANQQAEQLKVAAPPPTAPPAAKSPTDPAQAKDAAEKAAAPTPDEIAEIERKRAADCETAKRNLDTLKTRVHVRIRDDKTGEDRYLSAEEHAQRQKDASSHIDKYCAPANGG